MPTYSLANQQCHVIGAEEAQHASGRPAHVARCGLLVVKGTKLVTAVAPPGVLCAVCALGDADLATEKPALKKAFPGMFK